MSTGNPGMNANPSANPPHPPPLPSPPSPVGRKKQALQWMPPPPPPHAYGQEGEPLAQDSSQLRSHKTKGAQGLSFSMNLMMVKSGMLLSICPIIRCDEKATMNVACSYIPSYYDLPGLYRSSYGERRPGKSGVYITVNLCHPSYYTASLAEGLIISLVTLTEVSRGRPPFRGMCEVIQGAALYVSYHITISSSLLKTHQPCSI
mmetsp:Transcript_135/g.249  ORF Transcript_135/g.249 Transcript_135/m.249 type:complete len:204 (-) Transcript_135:114-725(-)